MRTARRHDLSPRVEMMPLIDVIFLLLTFFIYSLIVMVRAEVLPVQLTSLGTGQQGQGGEVQAVTIDRGGKLFFNREPVTLKQLDQRLAELAADPDHATLYLAVEAQGDVDRGPMLVKLLERVHKAGISNFAIVGPPEAGGEGDAEGGSSEGSGQE